MQKRSMLRWCVLGTSLLFLVTPLQIWADDSSPAVTPSSGLAPIVITEVQPGSAGSSANPSGASEEFVEIYNTTTQPINLAANQWQLEIASATAVSWVPLLRTVLLAGTIAPSQSYVVASQLTSSTTGQSVEYLPGVASAWFSAGLSAGGGHIRLTYSTNQTQSDGTCSTTKTVDDEVEWSAPKSATQPPTLSLDGRNVFAESGNVAGGSSIQRQTDQTTAHNYIDTNNDAADFAVSTSPSPAALNAVSLANPPANTAPVTPLPADGCDPNPPVVPAPTTPPDDTTTDPSTGTDTTTTPPATDDTSDQTGTTTPSNTLPDQSQLLPPQLTELLPNPAPPATDAADEFIELYNPNAAAFDLKSYTLETGTTTLHDFTFTDDLTIPGNSYEAFYSADTNLSLSNSGGGAKFLDPTGNTLSTTATYDTAKDGQAWALASDNTWQWTTTPTPNAPNVITQPIVAAAAPKAPTVAKPKTTTPKTTVAKTVKGATTTKAAKPKATKATTTKKATTSTANFSDTASVTTPIHPAVLALVGGLALLYGLYEYRTDVGNKLYQFQRYRSTRRETRGKP